MSVPNNFSAQGVLGKGQEGSIYKTLRGVTYALSCLGRRWGDALLLGRYSLEGHQCSGLVCQQLRLW